MDIAAEAVMTSAMRCAVASGFGDHNNDMAGSAIFRQKASGVAPSPILVLATHCRSRAQVRGVPPSSSRYHRAQGRIKAAQHTLGGESNLHHQSLFVLDVCSST